MPVAHFLKQWCAASSGTLIFEQSFNYCTEMRFLHLGAPTVSAPSDTEFPLSPAWMKCKWNPRPTVSLYQGINQWQRCIKRPRPRPEVFGSVTSSEGGRLRRPEWRMRKSLCQRIMQLSEGCSPRLREAQRNGSVLDQSDKSRPHAPLWEIYTHAHTHTELEKKKKYIRNL